VKDIHVLAHYLVQVKVGREFEGPEISRARDFGML
jgi:hypothetical protein